jgi:hypothetical protein
MEASAAQAKPQPAKGTVTGAVGEPQTKQTKKGGTFTKWKLKVATDVDGYEEIHAEWLDFDNTGNRLPDGTEVTLEKDLTYGWKIPPKGGSKGGGKKGSYQTHPVDAKRMSRCHAQDMAISVIQVELGLGIFEPEGEDAAAKRKRLHERIHALTDAYERDSLSGTPPLETGGNDGGK